MSRTQPEDPSKPWRRAVVVLQIIVVLQAVMMGLIADSRDTAKAERDEARATAVEMWPDWVKNHEPKPWAYILPCPRGEMDVQGMEWMPTTVQP